MGKNIILTLSLVLFVVAIVQSKKDTDMYEHVISKQRAQIANLEYQINQCKILYIGL